MAEVQIKKMRISHEMILNWLMLNPEKTQGVCAKEFGVTEAWLSTVINSDCFQARWTARRMMMDKRSVELAEAKMRGVVDRGLERLEEMVETSPDPRFVLDTTDKILGRLGYGPKTGAGLSVNVQANTFMVSKEVLAAARGEIVESGAREARREAPVLEAREVASLAPPVETFKGLKVPKL